MLCSSVFNHAYQKPRDPLNSKDISDSAVFSLKHEAYLDTERVFVPVIPDYDQYHITSEQKAELRR